MHPSAPASFLNIDVELKSLLDLTPLAKHLEEFVYVLQCDAAENGYILCMEPLIEGLLNTDANAGTEHMLSILEHLPEQLQVLLRSCITRVFDYGFDGGLEDKPTSIDISPTQLARIAALDAAVRVTVYTYRSDVKIEEEQTPASN